MSWLFIERADVEAETPILWPPDMKSWLFWKDPDAGKDWRKKEKGTTEDKIVGWHHRLNGHGSGWTPGVGEGQGGLACCGSWSCKELDTTEQLNWTELNWIVVQGKNPKSPLDCKEIKSVNPKGNQPWIFIRKTVVEAPIPWPSDAKNRLFGKDPDAGKDWRQEKRAKRIRWFNSITNSVDTNLSKHRVYWRAKESGMLQSMGLERVWHSLATEQQQYIFFLLYPLPQENSFYPTAPPVSSKIFMILHLIDGFWSLLYLTLQ